jgi:hypothetical protein
MELRRLIFELSRLTLLLGYYFLNSIRPKRLFSKNNFIHIKKFGIFNQGKAFGEKDLLTGTTLKKESNFC